MRGHRWPACGPRDVAVGTDQQRRRQCPVSVDKVIDAGPVDWIAVRTRGGDEHESPSAQDFVEPGAVTFDVGHPAPHQPVVLTRASWVGDTDAGETLGRQAPRLSGKRRIELMIRRRSNRRIADRPNTS